MTRALTDLLMRLKRTPRTEAAPQAAGARVQRSGEEIEAARLAAMVRSERARAERAPSRRLTAAMG